MRLDDSNNFEINVGGAITPEGDYPKLEDVLNLKIRDVIGEEHGQGATLQLDDGKKLFIKAVDEIAAQCLREIILIIQKEYKGEEVENIIKQEFCSAGRMK